MFDLKSMARERLATIGKFLLTTIVYITMVYVTAQYLTGCGAHAGSGGRAEFFGATDGARCYVIFWDDQPVGANCQ